MTFRLFDAPPREPSQFVGFAGNRIDRQSETRADDCVETALADPRSRLLLLREGRVLLKLDGETFELVLEQMPRLIGHGTGKPFAGFARCLQLVERRQEIGALVHCDDLGGIGKQHGGAGRVVTKQGEGRVVGHGSRRLSANRRPLGGGRRNAWFQSLSSASSSSISPSIIDRPCAQNDGSVASSPKGFRSSEWCLVPPAFKSSKYFAWKPDSAFW